MTAVRAVRSSSQAAVSPHNVAHGSSAQLLTTDQLAERWQVSKAHVYRLAREKRIPAVAIGRYYRFRLSSIEAWEIESEAAADA